MGPDEIGFSFGIFWVLFFFPPKNREKSGQTSLNLPAYGSLNGETIWEHEVLCHWMLGVAQFRNSLRWILNNAAILIGTSNRSNEHPSVPSKSRCDNMVPAFWPRPIPIISSHISHTFWRENSFGGSNFSLALAGEASKRSLTLGSAGRNAVVSETQRPFAPGGPYDLWPGG